MKISKTNYLILNLSIILLSLFLLNGCQQDSTLNEANLNNSNVLEKDGLRTPDTFVHGDVTRNGNPVVGAKVELWKDGNLLPNDYKDSPYSDKNGSYYICVCCKHAGCGTYVVKTEINVHGETWAKSESFYWNDLLGPWDFPIDLPLVHTERKGND